MISVYTFFGFSKNIFNTWNGRIVPLFHLRRNNMMSEEKRNGKVIPLLLSLGLFALLFHAMTNLLINYFINAIWLLTVDYILLGLTIGTEVLVLSKERFPIRLQPAQVLLVLFMVWFILSCISMTVTFNNDWVNYNNYPLLNTAISMFLAFPLGYVLIREKQNIAGTILLHTLLICWTVFITYVLIRVFQKETIPTPNGGIIRVRSGGLQLNCNRNINGAWEMMVFLVCCYLIFRCRLLPFKIFYGISSVIHFIALALSNSRASILSALAGFAAMAGILVYLRLTNKQRPHSLLWSVIAALIAGIAFYFLSGLVIKLYNNVSASTLSTRTELDKIVKDTGRIGIWKATIEGIFTSFRTAVFGVTPMSVGELIHQMQGEGSVTHPHAHNQFLEIAAANGLPALGLFLGWFFLILKDTWKLFFRQKNRTTFLFVPVIILALMFQNQFEAFLVYGYETMGFTFFLLCGILHGRVNDPLPAGHLAGLPIISKLRTGMSRICIRKSIHDR